MAKVKLTCSSTNEMRGTCFIVIISVTWNDYHWVSNSIIQKLTVYFLSHWMWTTTVFGSVTTEHWSTLGRTHWMSGAAKHTGSCYWEIPSELGITMKLNTKDIKWKLYNIEFSLPSLLVELKMWYLTENPWASPATINQIWTVTETVITEKT